MSEYPVVILTGVTKDTFPFYFNLSNSPDTTQARRQLRQLLREMAGQDASRIEVATEEALNNALRYGTRVLIKVKHLILRIKDNGPGFPENLLVAKLATLGVVEALLSGKALEHGRGIPILLVWMDKVLYNMAGTEVLLVKRLAAYT